MKKITPSPTPFIAVITQDETLFKLVYSYAKSFTNIEFKHFLSVADFIIEKCNRPISSAFIDFRLAMKLTSRERDELSFVENIIPYFKIRMNPKGQLAAIGTIKFGEGESFFTEFYKEISIREPKKLRSQYRQKIYFNMLISFGDSFNPTTSFKTNSDNISVGGIYIISADEWDLSKKIWIQFADFKEIRPIECISRWHLKWGESYKTVAGYGLEFLNLDAKQMDQINRLVYQPLNPQLK